MISVGIKSFFNIFRFFWLTGPLFDKELRISSRRRRNYYLRFAYVLLLIVFVGAAWLSVDHLRGSIVYQKSRLAEIGQNIVITIAIFQFIAAQILAIILLSNSISDEIYHRTLGVLMTTPINSMQIVIGKLLSKMLQIIILLTISLPILTIVRVFGGVSLNYIFSSFFITVTAAIFAGSISLAFSIKNRHAYVVIIKTVFTLGVIYFILPIFLAAAFGEEWISILFHGNIRHLHSYIIFSHLNPLAVMSINTFFMLSPPAFNLPYFWPVHCVFMLITSAILLAYSMKVVRRVALRQILGELDFFSRLRLSFSKDKANKIKEYRGSIREVFGPPVFWKEIRKPLIQGIDNTNNKIGFTAAIAALFLTYLVCKLNGCLEDEIVHVLYVSMFVVIGLIFNMVLSVSSITSEKESSAWPILLTTSLDDWRIMYGKALGIFYKCMPVWLLLAGHLIVFVIVGYIHPIALLQVPIIVTGVVVFITGFGIYISSLCKKTTWAIIISFISFLFIWLFVPIIIGAVTSLLGHDDIYEAIFGLYYSLNPLVQIGVIMDSIAGIQNADLSLSDLNYNWANYSFFENITKVLPTTQLLMSILLCYSSLGVFFAWMAQKRFRKNIV